jgi:acyl-CoA synthetase (AMP-forming)/AMP-acid ligase II
MQEWRTAVWHYADIANVADIVRHYGRKTPGKAALVEGGFKLAWGELDDVSTRLASALRARGVREGDVVAYLGKNSIPFFEVLYGAAKAGASLLTLNWRLAAPELAAIIDDAQPSIVFAEQELESLLQGSLAPTARPDVPRVMLRPRESVHGGLEAFLTGAAATDPGGPSDPRRTAWLMYTSGTTGRAKGVELSHLGLDRMRLSEHFEPVFQWKSDDVLMMVMPNFHLLGTALPVQAMYNGCTVSIMPVLEPGKLLALVRETKPTILVVAPTVIQMMLDHPTRRTPTSRRCGS